jgi:hypothetical protein
MALTISLAQLRQSSNGRNCLSKNAARIECDSAKAESRDQGGGGNLKAPWEIEVISDRFAADSARRRSFSRTFLGPAGRQREECFER